MSPATNTAQKSHRSYRLWTLPNASGVTPGTYVKKNSDTPSQTSEPIPYPIMPPMTEVAVATPAKLSDRDAAPRQSAMSNGSGGMGKTDDSARASAPSAGSP